MARHFYMDDLIYAHDYVPGKNSFVVQNLMRGKRKTVLDLRGSGSVRHLWSTWLELSKEDRGTNKDKILLRVFVDGERKPSIVGAIDDLCLAAEKSGTRYIPQPSFNFAKSFNLYLPIFFARGIRMEIEALGDFQQFYAQIDYRRTRRPEAEARLISANTAQGLALKYIGRNIPAFGNRQSTSDQLESKSWETSLAPGGGSDTFEIRGPAILRRLAFDGENLGGLEVSITWDDENTPAVRAPIQYLFGGFETLALESQPGQFACYFPMPFLRQARIQLRNSTPLELAVKVHFGVDRNTPVPAVPYYFHAQFRELNPSVGYQDFVVLNTNGEGHFVGVNLFDTGHDHGGGDTVLIDAATPSPHVLHGICGEDYFSFAWFGTGRMHFLAGAPEQSRRYRFHLENPYPFRSYLIFTFGVFAGLHPKGVAFWYQKAVFHPSTHWLAVEAPWEVFGPLAVGDAIPDEIGDRTIETAVPIVKPERFKVGWNEAEMVQGFLDLSHHYRLYIMTSEGSGFIAGKCRLKAVTFIHSARDVKFEALIGHDDALRVSVNDAPGIKLPDQVGFQTSRIKLQLRSGWNKLALVLANDENVDWRWLGFSLAFHSDKSNLLDLKFSVAAPPNEPIRAIGRQEDKRK